jgi:hypothetical protein
MQRGSLLGPRGIFLSTKAPKLYGRGETLGGATGREVEGLKKSHILGEGPAESGPKENGPAVRGR